MSKGAIDCREVQRAAANSDVCPLGSIVAVRRACFLESSVIRDIFRQAMEM